MMTPEERRELIDANVQVFGMAYVYDQEHVLDPAKMVIHGEPSITEHKRGVDGQVFRRRVILVEDWTEVTEP